MASGLGRSSARDECPPGEVANASAEAMPRWRCPTRHAGRLADDRPLRGRAPARWRGRPGRRVAPFSSSPENSTATSRGRRPAACRSASASQDGGDGPLGVGAAQAVQASVPHRGRRGAGRCTRVLAGTVSMWALSSSEGDAPKQASTAWCRPTAKRSTRSAPSAASSLGQVLGHGALVPAGVLCIERHQLGSAAGPDCVVHRRRHGRRTDGGQVNCGPRVNCGLRPAAATVRVEYRAVAAAPVRHVSVMTDTVARLRRSRLRRRRTTPRSAR